MRMLVAVVVLLSAVSPVRAKKRITPTNPYPSYQSATYADPAHWLCRGDTTDDVCDHDLDATRVDANGKTKLERFREARHPKIDCFYVYPTISTDPGGNSDLVPGANEELFVVRQQAARLGRVCRVFAPVYRQVTLTALLNLLGGGGGPAGDRALAYADVVDAWKHYVANDSHGRGVLLIGHSQGAGILAALLAQEIDQKPEVSARLVSAVLLGTSLQVPVGQDVGGDLKSIPLCRSPRQTGCVITYGSFRATSPPPSNSLFGRPGAGTEAGCTNPASLKGGSGVLQPYLPTDGKSLSILPPHTVDWVDPSKGVTISTPFVTLPRWVSSECKVTNGFSYLAITLLGQPSDPRIDDLTGADLTPEWGLHLVDVNVAMGDLVDIADQQAKAYCKSHRCPAAR